MYTPGRMVADEIHDHLENLLRFEWAMRVADTDIKSG